MTSVTLDHDTAAAVHLLPCRTGLGPEVAALSSGPALRVIAWAVDAAETPSPEELGSRLALAWEEQGIRVEVTVVGRAFSEEHQSTTGYLGTSVEIFLRDPAQPERCVQVVVMPGVALDQAAVRVQGFDHRPPALATMLGPITATAERLRTTQGYQLAIRVPLSAIGLSPAAGVRLGMRVLINHRAPGTERVRETWTGVDPEGAQLLECGPADDAPMGGSSSATGTTIVTAGWMQFLQATQVTFRAILPPAAVGQAMVVRAGDRVLAQAPAMAWHGRAFVQLVLPVAAVPAQVPLAILWQEQVVGSALLTDLVPYYRGLIPQLLQHPAYLYQVGRSEREEFGLHGTLIFQGTELPQLTIASAAVRQLTGALPVELRFLDGEGRTVTSADRVGRYGAVATIRWPDGSRAIGTQTVVRIPDDEPQWRSDSLFGRLLAMFSSGSSRAWPPGLPVLGASVLDALSRDTQAACMVAALLEADDHSCRPDWQNRSWWHRARAGAGIRQRYPGILRLPQGYDSGAAQRHPAIIYLHGGGGAYAPFDQRRPGDLHRYAEAANGFPFVVYELQACDWWDSTAIADSVAELITAHRIDPERIIISGFSMGGYGTWQAALDTPELYAAAIPMGAGPGQPWEAQRCAQLPIWCMNGGADGTTTCAQAEGMVAALRAAGSTVRYTVQPGLDHLQHMTASLHVPGLWEWALAQRRGRRDPLPPI